MQHFIAVNSTGTPGTLVKKLSKLDENSTASIEGLRTIENNYIRPYEFCLYTSLYNIKYKRNTNDAFLYSYLIPKINPGLIKLFLYKCANVMNIICHQLHNMFKREQLLLDKPLF